MIHLIPVHNVHVGTIEASFSDTIIVDEMHGEMQSLTDTIVVEDTFLTVEVQRHFRDTILITETLVNSGASGLVGSPMEVINITESFGISVDGDTAYLDTVVTQEIMIAWVDDPNDRKRYSPRQ